MQTIVAIATGVVNSGISIVRVSGDKAFEISQNCLPKLDVYSMQERYMALTELAFGTVKDKAIVVKFVSPKSFTGEDVVEFHLHGSYALAQKAVEYLISCGAVLATPGEFSKRAFLNGKLSLEEAEGVVDLINAESEAELNASYNLMIGKLKGEIVSLQTKLTDTLAEIEVAIDYPEEDIEYKTQQDVKILLKEVLDGLQTLILNSNIGEKIKTGIQVCIVGKPNVGKSSLLNALLNYDKAIVTEIEGTTRDVVEGSYEFGGVKFNLIDTAGIRESTDKVEKIGIDRAKQMLSSSSVILCVVDGSSELGEQDKDVFALVKAYKSKTIVIIKNKADSKNFNNENMLSYFADFDKVTSINISAKQKTNIAELKSLLYDLTFANKLDSNAVYITNERQVQCLKQAQKHLIQALDTIDNVGIDCLSLDIKNAWNELGKITGKIVTEEVVDAIFSKFCLGK